MVWTREVLRVAGSARFELRARVAAVSETIAALRAAVIRQGGVWRVLVPTRQTVGRVVLRAQPRVRRQCGA